MTFGTLELNKDYMKKVLITRFGGIGDCAPLQVVGTQLKKRGYNVTFAVRADGAHMNIADLFLGNPAFDAVLELRQIGPWNSRCIKTDLGMVSINTIYPDFDVVLDYMNIIENNSTSPVMAPGVGDEWQASRNSNWVNWIDLHLAWANIDPKSVPDEEKRPEFVLSDIEKEQSKKFRQGYDKVFVMQTTASSLSRTWYQGDKLTKLVLAEHKNSVVYYWDAKKSVWLKIDSKGTKVIKAEGSPLRYTLMLINACDFYVGADTGFTHVAEGLAKPHVAIYSTVPGWTRAGYYKYQTIIDPGQDNPEFYTFNLALGDPLRILEGEESLTEREKLVATLYDGGKGIQEAADALGTSEQGAELELQALVSKKASFEQQQSKALATVSADQVFNKIKEVFRA